MSTIIPPPIGWTTPLGCIFNVCSVRGSVPLAPQRLSVKPNQATAPVFALAKTNKKRLHLLHTTVLQFYMLRTNNTSRALEGVVLHFLHTLPVGRCAAERLPDGSSHRGVLHPTNMHALPHDWTQTSLSIDPRLFSGTRKCAKLCSFCRLYCSENPWLELYCR